MPLIDDLKPGARIFNFTTTAKGTFTCFARKPSERSILYGITAKHVLREPTDKCCLASSNDLLEVGTNSAPTGRLDCIYFVIAPNVRTELKKENFVPRGTNVEPIQVWNPSKFQLRVSKAVTDTKETELKAETKSVQFFGATQAALTTGALNKFDGGSGSTVINRTTIAKGDSGGCVLNSGGLRYVGLISFANTDGQATGGGVVLLHSAFNAAGLILATWEDREYWV